MNKLVAFGVAAAGGVIAWRCLPPRTRDHLSAGVGNWVGKRMMRHFERMMASLPDNAPPKLVMSILPALQAQNEQIIAMLREQNELIRKQQQDAPARG